MRDSVPQATLDRAARLANLRGAFALDPARLFLVQGRHVALVDDVMTTGATLFEAAAVLRRVGALRVTALVLARNDDALPQPAQPDQAATPVESVTAG